MEVCVHSNWLGRAALTAGFLMLSVLLWAHHGNAAFDTSKRVSLKGTVVQWLWANPHCVLTFDVKDDKGNVVRWSGETGGGVGFGQANHWRRDSLKPGDEVTVTVTPAKNGTPIGRIEKVVFPDGRTLTSAIPPDSPTEPKP
jgi:hypothetical protein